MSMQLKVPILAGNVTARDDLADDFETKGELAYLASERTLVVGHGDGKTQSEFLDKTAVSQAIADATAQQNAGASGGLLLTEPSLTVPSAAQSGKSVSVTVSGSQYLWGGADGVSYKITLHDGAIKSGTSASFTMPSADAEVSVVAVDSHGNMSPTVNKTIAVSTNSAPSAAGITSDLPGNLTRGSIYTVTFNGASDSEGGLLTYNVENVQGCVATRVTTRDPEYYRKFSLRVDNSTTVSFDVTVTDAEGITSTDRKSFLRSGSSISQPTGSSGDMGPGTHTVTVPTGVNAVTITGNGGASSTTYKYTTCECPYGGAEWTGTKCVEGSGGDRQTWPTGSCHYAYDSKAGESTTISGAVNHTFHGATALPTRSTTLYSATQYHNLQSPVSVVKPIDASTESTITVTVAANGGTCRIDW